MAATALKWITRRAQELSRTGKGMPWASAIKKASAEYRSRKAHGLSSKVGKAKKRAPKKTARKKIVRKLKKLHNQEGRVIRRLGGTLSAGASAGIMGVRSTFQAAAIGRLTTAQHISHAKEKIAQEIGRAEMAKFRAKTKTAKRKISKRISALKARFRKLC